MANRLMRAWLTRAAVAAAVFALPALGAGTASAAIAGAPHESTTNRPDLVSATILPSAFGQAVDFCYDKTLTSTTGTGKFLLKGYRAHNTLVATVYALETTLAPPAGLPADSCIRANFPNDVDGNSIDLNKYTIGTVLPSAVAANGGVPTGADGNNLTDSTPLTGSSTHNGTSGFTTGPDLSSVIPDSTSNSITYFFDQEHSGAPVAGDFYFVDAAGNTCFGSAVIANGAAGHNSITVSFASDSCFNATTSISSESVSSAVRAGDVQGAVSSDNDTNSPNVDNSLPVTGTGTTALPDLTDVKMEANQSALDFTFDKTVSPDTAADFFADLSNGTEVSGNNATVIAVSTSSTTLRVTFPNFSTYDEYVVGGSVDGVGSNGCAVFISAISSTSCNINGSQPLDAPFGNIGAFATGYTTGPDVLGAVGNTTTNVVTVALDQRAFFACPGASPAPNAATFTPSCNSVTGATLLDGTGNPVATATSTSWSLPTQAAGPESATITFSSGQVGQAQNLDLPSETLYTNTYSGPTTSCIGGECADQPNVSQILAITKTSSLVKAALHAKPMSKATAARITKARRAAAQRKLAKLIAKHKKHHRKHHR